VACGAGRSGVVVPVDGCGGKRWFFFISRLLLLLPLFFVHSVNNILPSLRWSRVVQLVTAKKKNGVAASGSRRRRERGRRERLLFFSLLFVFFPLYFVLFPFLLSPAPIFHSLFPWFCWRLLSVLLVAVERKKQQWCPEGEDGFSSSLCRDRSLCFSLPTSVFAFSFFFFVSVACFPLFSKKILPRLLLFPCIYRQQGERFTIPFPSAGHGGVGWLLCSCCRAWASSSFIVVVGYGGYG